MYAKIALRETSKSSDDLDDPYQHDEEYEDDTTLTPLELADVMAQMLHGSDKALPEGYVMDEDGTIAPAEDEPEEPEEKPSNLAISDAGIQAFLDDLEHNGPIPHK